jgi:hypothetical protein
MRLTDLREQLERKPFRPLRLHLTDGSVFDVSHPDMAIAGHAALTLSLPPALGLERDAVIDLLPIMSLEVLSTSGPPAPPGTGDGASPPPS